MSTKRQLKEEAARREAEARADNRFDLLKYFYLAGCVLLFAALMISLWAASFLMKNSSNPKNIKTNLETYIPWPKEIRKEFQKLMIQNGGRVKPVNTFARFTLLQISNSTGVSFETKDGEKHRISADAWLMDALFRPSIARELPVFNVDDTATVAEIGVKPKEGSDRHRKRDRYSYNQFLPYRSKMSEEASRLTEKKKKFDASDDDPDLALDNTELQLLRVSRNVSLLEYMMGQFAVVRKGEDMVNSEMLPDSLLQIARNLDIAEFMDFMPEMSPQQLLGVLRQPADTADARLFQAPFQLFFFYANSGRNFVIFPPLDRMDEEWGGIGDGLFEAMQDKGKRDWIKTNLQTLTTFHEEQKKMFTALASLGDRPEKSKVNEIAKPMKDAMAGFVARQENEIDARYDAKLDDINQQIAASSEELEKERLNDKKDKLKIEGATSDREVRFYNTNYFVKAIVFFIGGFLVLAMSWLLPGSLFAKVTSWLSIILCIVGLIVVVVGIWERCFIRQRPPISNLYETVLFITAVAVLLCLILEAFTRIGVGKLLAVVIGMGGMFLSQRYEIKEATDTMDPLIAVLDTNFWLATHVTTINIGYAAGLLAMFLGVVYLLYRFLKPLPSVFKSLLGKEELQNNELFSEDKATRDRLKKITSMTYGIVCFCLIFSIIGTVLGGVWANYSWGRFWGWDPKENGALMICLWSLVILHARMGGYIKQIGMAVNSVILGMIVTFSWWGVNNLGIGLHSYGFTAGVWKALYISWLVSLLIMACGIPLWFHERTKQLNKLGKMGKTDTATENELPGEGAPA